MAGELFTYSQLYISKEVVVLKKESESAFKCSCFAVFFCGRGMFRQCEAIDAECVSRLWEWK